MNILNTNEKRIIISKAKLDKIKMVIRHYFLL